MDENLKMARIQKHHIMSDTAPSTALALDIPKHLTKQEFGRRLNQLMLNKGMHHAELARRSDLPRNNISTYINGRSYPTEQSLAKLARALGVTPDELLPNRAEMAIRGEAMPDFSMKSSVADPSKTWLNVNRLVSTAVAVKIAVLLEEERLASEPSNGSDH
jgi:transcriptional regulator with XRE-family HTH domain